MKNLLIESDYKNMPFKYIVLDEIKKDSTGSTRRSIARALSEKGFERNSELDKKISNAVQALRKDGRLTNWPWKTSV